MMIFMHYFCNKPKMCDVCYFQLDEQNLYDIQLSDFGKIHLLTSLKKPVTTDKPVTQMKILKR